jgi:hypothetical protein
MQFKIFYEASPLSEVAKEMTVSGPNLDSLTHQEAVQCVNSMRETLSLPAINVADVIRVEAI